MSNRSAAMGFAAIFHEPAIWGVLGAFIYAAPRLVACLLSCRETGVSVWFCIMEFAVALATGAISAAAFAAAAMSLTHLRDTNAVSATIGILANPLAPRMVATLSRLLNAAVASKLGRVLLGEDKP